ncbi:MAG: thioesterase family protein [Burkholderiales bacterium]|nr:thioesterase family protein [Burkholderiales bacterium]
MPNRDDAFPAPVRAALRKLFEEDIAFNQVLGFRTLSYNPDRPRVRFDMRPELLGHPIRKILHGGVIAGVLDATAGYALMLAVLKAHAGETVTSLLGRFRHMSTIDLRIDYVRPGRGAHFLATAQVLRVGSKVATVRMDLENDSGELIAAGTAAFAVG